MVSSSLTGKAGWSIFLLLTACGSTPTHPSAKDHGSSADVRLELPGLFPESVVYDAERERFLVGSFREGNVYEVRAHGEVRRVVEDSRLISILGIALDPGRRRVLVASSDLGAGRRSSATGPRTVAAFGSYSLTDGSPAHYVDLGALLPDRPHLANGLATDPSGNAYVTDSFASAI
jgi:sugar lactone lactonase YvrE